MIWEAANECFRAVDPRTIVEGTGDTESEALEDFQRRLLSEKRRKFARNLGPTAAVSYRLKHRTKQYLEQLTAYYGFSEAAMIDTMTCYFMQLTFQKGVALYQRKGV